MGSTTGTSTEHRYPLCRDESCERYACRIFKEGQRDGYDLGWHRGRAAGHAEGFQAGYAEGVASCPRNHA